MVDYSSWCKYQACDDVPDLPSNFVPFSDEVTNRTFPEPLVKDLRMCGI